MFAGRNPDAIAVPARDDRRGLTPSGEFAEAWNQLRGSWFTAR